MPKRTPARRRTTKIAVNDSLTNVLIHNKVLIKLVHLRLLLSLAEHDQGTYLTKVKDGRQTNA